jgi:hypothetical protein
VAVLPGRGGGVGVVADPGAVGGLGVELHQAVRVDADPLAGDVVLQLDGDAVTDVGAHDDAAG